MLDGRPYTVDAREGYLVAASDQDVFKQVQREFSFLIHWDIGSIILGRTYVMGFNVTTYVKYHSDVELRVTPAAIRQNAFQHFQHM